MRLRLQRRAETDDLLTLAARAQLPDAPVRVTYATRTGALLRIDGAAAAAFDGKHRTCVLPATPGSHELTFEVEKRALPIAGLPSGGGLRWRLMLARSGARAARAAAVDANSTRRQTAAVEVTAVGHAHLDVAWLWRYVDSRRKALRTFATAIRQVEAGGYVFAQSQPQLYAWVEADDPALFERVRARAGRGWDASVASMWVEPDLHAPSGESILRQLAYGMRYAAEKLRADARVVWLPDTFGFPSTLPSLAAHAGASAFVTTKLQWNETTRWPYPQFVWRGPDGAALTSAVIDAYDGGVDPGRVARARARREPLVVGFGDGGGGATDDDVAAVAPRCWTPVARWLAALDAAALPEHRGELYLETHRGTYTTHRDVKSRNAALERALEAAEEACAWCVAVRAAPAVVAPLLTDLRTAWTIVLRNQFHDVLAGTCIADVYADVHAEYERAERIVARVHESARSLLPRAGVERRPAPCIVPVPAGGGGFALANEFVRAHVRDDGIVTELGAAGGPNVASVVNAFVAYVDRPAHWDAWNIDAAYRRRTVRVRPQRGSLEDEGIVVRFRVGRRSAATMRLELRAGEPFVRVELAVQWREDHTLLRVEHRFAVAAKTVRFGEPHGSLERGAYPATAAERARFEVPAQRWALVDDGTRGCAVLAPDSYGWSADGLRGGGVRLGMSLLRAPRWPDPGADRGEHRIAYALAPTAGALPSALEAAWNDYAAHERVRLFEGEDAAVLIVAVKPADDGDGVVLRVRECDGAARAAVLRCGGRMRAAACVDALERPVAGEVAIVDETLRFALPAYGIRSFRVRF